MIITTKEYDKQEGADLPMFSRNGRMTIN